MRLAKNIRQTYWLRWGIKLPTISQLQQDARQILSSVTETAALDVDLLLAHVLQQSRSHLYSWPEKKVGLAEMRCFHELLQRRCAKEPVAYLLGYKEHWSLIFKVTSATLIPRPETECLIEFILQLFRERKVKIADLGTGCGTIGLSLAHERPAWQIVMTDQSEAALQVATQNAEAFQLQNVLFAAGHWCQPLKDFDFDLIVSNPPYIANTEWDVYASELLFEPRDALVSGEDGLDAIRELCEQARHHLKLGGYLLVEHGFAQGREVRQIFSKMGYEQVKSMRDFAGHERMTVACRVS